MSQRTCYLSNAKIGTTSEICLNVACPANAARLHSFRTPAMLDVVNLRRYKCQGGDCARQAYYNFAGLGRGKAKFCSTHKLPDMLNVRHRLCESEGCGTTPTFSFAGDRPRYDAARLCSGRISGEPLVIGRPEDRSAGLGNRAPNFCHGLSHWSAGFDISCYLM